MLLREDGEEVVAISQPAHAWVSGQLARYWGNDRFGTFNPLAEVCLAADQHDIGFLEWEQAPDLDSQTGLPHSFMAMPLLTHLDIWTRSVQDVLAFSRYAAWLVSLHVTGLGQRHLSHAPDHEKAVLHRFLDQQHHIRSTLQTSLRQDPLYAPFSTDTGIDRNRQLVATWDWMSLILLLGFTATQSIEEVPAAPDRLTLTLHPETEPEPCYRVDPWPFHTRRVDLRSDAKRFRGRFTDQTAMREALQQATPESVLIRLRPWDRQ